jgi:hypothetical protein
LWQCWEARSPGMPEPAWERETKHCQSKTRSTDEVELGSAPRSHPVALALQLRCSLMGIKRCELHPDRQFHFKPSAFGQQQQDI